MIRLPLSFMLLLGAAPLFAQKLGVNLSAGIRKTFECSKQASLEVRQQIQLNPEIAAYDNRYGDFFNEDGFWRIPDSQGGTAPSTGGTGELNDDPLHVAFRWRSNTATQFNYRFFNWLRSNAGYALLYDGDAFRHTFRAEMDYRPCRHGTAKRKIDLAARCLFQRIGQMDDDTYTWDAFLVPRLDAEWTFIPNHVLFVSQSCNGVLGGTHLDFDRYRINAGLKFSYKKIHRFTLNYQFQQRLGLSDGRTKGVSFGYEIRL